MGGHLRPVVRARSGATSLVSRTGSRAIRSCSAADCGRPRHWRLRRLQLRAHGMHASEGLDVLRRSDAHCSLMGRPFGLVDEMVEHHRPGSCKWCEGVVAARPQAPSRSRPEASSVMPELQLPAAQWRSSEHDWRVVQIIQRPLTVEVLASQLKPQRLAYVNASLRSRSRRGRRGFSRRDLPKQPAEIWLSSSACVRRLHDPWRQGSRGSRQSPRGGRRWS